MRDFLPPSARRIGRDFNRPLAGALLLVVMALAATLIALFLVIPARSSGKPLTLPEYYQRMTLIREEALRESSDVVRHYSQSPQAVTGVSAGDEGSADGDGQVVNVTLPTMPPEQEQEKLEGLVAIVRKNSRNLAGIRPPQEVRDLHDEFVSASTAFAEEFESLVKSGASTDETVVSLTYGPTVRRFQDACLALRRYGLDRGIDVDLECN